VNAPCPVCHESTPAGAEFCPSCGWPLAPFPTGALPPTEILVGEIPSAFAIGPACGPVRIEFTDRRMIVRWLAPPSLLVRRRVLEEWRSSLPATPPERLLGTPWSDRSEPVAWEIANSAIGAIRGTKEVGIGVDPGFSQLTVSAWWKGIRVAPMGPLPWDGIVGRSGTVGAHWRVPGAAEELDSFLRALPIARVVGRIWVSPFRR